MNLSLKNNLASMIQILKEKSSVFFENFSIYFEGSLPQKERTQKYVTRRSETG
jgi:hypothetical protein